MRAEDWIPVEDALPPCSGEYLICAESGAIISVWYSPIHEAFNAHDYEASPTHAICDAYWMPIVLPKGGCGDD